MELDFRRVCRNDCIASAKLGLLQARSNLTLKVVHAPLVAGIDVISFTASRAQGDPSVASTPELHGADAAEADVQADRRLFRRTIPQ